MTTWVLFAGLPGTGKSTLARALAGRLDAAILDKDRVRAALFPAALIDYSASQDQVCMRSMLAAAAYLTEHRRVHFIFFDGRTFSTQAQRDEVLLAAKRAGVKSRILHVSCTDSVAEQRLTAVDPEHPARNRDPALYYAIKEHFEPIDDPKLEVDTTLGVDTVLGPVEAWLKGKKKGVR